MSDARAEQCVERGKDRYHEWRLIAGTGIALQDKVYCVYCLRTESIKDAQELTEAQMKWDRDRPRGPTSDPALQSIAASLQLILEHLERRRSVPVN